MNQNLTFVILSFNHPELTARCVRQTLQHVPAEQLLLFHNGSQEKFVNELQKQFPHIQHTLTKNNKGFSGGANQALSLAFEKSPWVFFLTNDTELLKWTEKVDLEPGFYAPLIWDRKQKNWDSCGGAFDPWQARLRHLRGPQDHLKNREHFYIPGTAFLLHKSIFEKLEGFDESYGTFWEDVDFSLRAQDLSLKMGKTDGFQVLHRGGKTCHKSSHYTLYLYQRNRWKLTLSFLKRHRRWLLACGLIFIYFSDFLRLSLRLLKQRRWKDWQLLGRAFCQL